MPEEIIGRGWVFPPRIDPQGGMALTSERTELDQSIRIILSTSPGQTRDAPQLWLSTIRIGLCPKQ